VNFAPFVVSNSGLGRPEKNIRFINGEGERREALSISGAKRSPGAGYSGRGAEASTARVGG
jgi:hypothetical protein